MNELNDKIEIMKRLEPTKFRDLATFDRWDDNIKISNVLGRLKGSNYIFENPKTKDIYAFELVLCVDGGSMIIYENTQNGLLLTNAIPYGSYSLGIDGLGKFVKKHENEGMKRLASHQDLKNVYLSNMKLHEEPIKSQELENFNNRTIYWMTDGDFKRSIWCDDINIATVGEYKDSLIFEFREVPICDDNMENEAYCKAIELTTCEKELISFAFSHLSERASFDKLIFEEQIAKNVQQKTRKPTMKLSR